MLVEASCEQFEWAIFGSKATSGGGKENSDFVAKRSVKAGYQIVSFQVMTEMSIGNKQ